MRKRLLAASLVICIIGVGLAVGLNDTRAAGSKAARRVSALASTASSSRARVSSEYGKLPLAFEANLGQSNGEAKFLAHGNGYALSLTPSEAVLALREPAKTKTAAHVPANVLRMQLVGANAAAAFTTTDELPGITNYILGNDPAKWHTNVPTYRKVAEKGVYPGIDLVYYGTQRQLEYDFVVGPQASVAPIHLAIQGTQKLKIDAQGELVMTVAGGEVRLEKPVAYQGAGSEKQLVAANYSLDANGGVRFDVGSYDHTRPLVVDPILAYSTYLGGSGIDGANAIAVASDNTAFITGGTYSTNFPTAHPIQALGNRGGPDDFLQDAFVTKISADGSTLLYSTYLGGHGSDVGNGIAVDAAGNAYVTGTTLSSDFPVTPGSFGTECGGDGQCGASFNSGGLIVSNGFLTKINAAGSVIIYSGYIGTYENVGGLAVAVDTNQNAYVTGETESNGFATNSSGTAVTYTIDPTNGAVATGGGFSTISVSSDVLIPLGQWVTISGVGVTLTNLTGETVFDGNFMVFSSSPGSIVIYDPAATGAAATGNGSVALNPAPPFPIGFTAYQEHFGGGSTDLFIAKISATGSEYLYTTYLGGDGEDVGYGIAVDKNADVYVAGLTYSDNFPESTGAFQSAYGGAGDAFFTEINTNIAGAAGLIYSTYLGGAGLDQANAIAVDSRPSSCTALTPNGTACNAYVAGGTASTGLGSSAIQSNCTMDSRTPPQCEGDAFIAEFNPNLGGTASRVFFTYLGGSLADTASGIALDQNANMYITGSTVSPDFPVSGAEFQSTYGGGNDDAFIAKIDSTTLTVDYASYLGGTDTDNGYGIAVDASGSAYVAGQTCSTNFPISNAEQVAPGGNCDAFVSKVSILQGIQLNPSSLAFPAQSLNTTSASQTVTITNGDVALTALTISMIGGADSADFAETTACPIVTQMSQFPVADQCAISVTFTPKATGVRTANITVTYTYIGPGELPVTQAQTISLTGTTSTLTLSPSALTFGSLQARQPVGTISAPQSIQLTNTGTVAVTISNVAPSGDFAETNNCTTAPLQPTTNCIINVTYAPTAAGTSVGAIAITDNAPGSPQVVIATGYAAVQPFTISAVSPNATVSAGQSAGYTLSITAIPGFSQPVALSCSNLPPNSTCLASQNPVTLSGGASTQVTLTISTTARTAVPLSPDTKVGPPAAGWVERLALPLLAVVFALAMLTTLGGFKGRRAVGTLVFAAGMVMLSVGCNGGSKANDPPGTPAGNYQVTVTGTSGTTTDSTTVNLQVN